MTPKTDNLLVKLLKKAVGLPTGDASCCGTVPLAPIPASSTSDAEVKPARSTGCGCASASAQSRERPA